MRSVTGLLHKAGMTGSVAPASDPFFLGGSRGKLLLQKLKGLKHELRTQIRHGVDMAIASFNLHQDFFTRRMNIRLANGIPAHSGCAAFGIERWSFGFVCQNGAALCRRPLAPGGREENLRAKQADRERHTNQPALTDEGWN